MVQFWILQRELFALESLFPRRHCWAGACVGQLAI